MAREEIPLVLIDPATGSAVQGASVEIRNRATNAVATIFTAETGASTISATGIVTSDANGDLNGWLDRGKYRATVTSGSLNGKVTNFAIAPGGDREIDELQLPQGGLPLVVTSLPASPVDGQEVYYLADSAGTFGGPFLWHLRYRAAAVSIYKWEPVAVPAELASFSLGGNNITATTYTTIVNGPSITVPLSGDYEAEFGIFLFGTDATLRNVFVAPGAVAPASDVQNALFYVNNSQQGAAYRRHRANVAALAANAVVTLYARHNVAGLTTSSGQNTAKLLLKPLRVG